MEPDATTTTTVEEYFGLVRGGIRIPSSVKEKAILYITSTLDLESGEEVQDMHMGVDTFLDAMAAAWEAEMPGPLVGMLRKWFESSVSKPKPVSFKKSATPTPPQEYRRRGGISLTPFRAEPPASDTTRTLRRT